MRGGIRESRLDLGLRGGSCVYCDRQDHNRAPRAEAVETLDEEMGCKVGVS